MYGPPRDCKGIVRPRELISIPLSLNGRDHARSIDPFDPPSSGSDSRSSCSVGKSATLQPYLRFGDTKEESNDRTTLQSWYRWIGAGQGLGGSRPCTSATCAVR